MCQMMVDPILAEKIENQRRVMSVNPKLAATHTLKLSITQVTCKTFYGAYSVELLWPDVFSRWCYYKGKDNAVRPSATGSMLPVLLLLCLGGPATHPPGRHMREETETPRYLGVGRRKHVIKSAVITTGDHEMCPISTRVGNREHSACNSAREAENHDANPQVFNKSMSSFREQFGILQKRIEYLQLLHRDCPLIWTWKK